MDESGDHPAVRSAMRWVLAAFYMGAGVLHLSDPQGFLPIVPDWVPWPYQVIMVTGLCEVAGSLGLLVPVTRSLAGMALALYAVCVFPANIKHALYNISVGGLPQSWWYHGPRLVFQPVLVWWALYCAGVTNWPFRRSVASGDAVIPNRGG